MSFRSKEARIFSSGDHECNYQRSESVAMDVSIMCNSEAPFVLGKLADSALSSFYLYQLAYCTNEHIAEYILAWSTYGQDSNILLIDTLRSLRRAQPNWGGNEVIQACIMVRILFEVILESLRI